MSLSGSMKFVAFFALVLSMAISPSFSNYAFANDGTYVYPISDVSYVTAAADKGTNAIAKINATTYALAYAGADNDGFITTYSIATDGTISALGTVEHDTADALHHSMVYRDTQGTDCTNNYLGCVGQLILSYEANANDLTVSTFNYTTNNSGPGSSGGIIPIKAVLTAGAAPVELLATNVATPNSLVQIDSDAFAVAHADAAGDGTVTTFIVNSSGAILTKWLQTYEYGNTGSISGTAPTQEIIKIDADTFAVANRGAGDDGFISTFDINGTGAISTSVAQNHEFDITDSEDFSAVLLDSDTVAIAYTNAAGGAITTVTINSTGGVSAGTTLQHDTVSAAGNELVKVDSNTVALAYSGTINTGGAVASVIKSFTIDVASVTGHTITEANVDDTILGMPGTTHTMVQASSDAAYVLALTEAAAVGQVVHLTIKTDSLNTTPAPNFGCYDCVKPQLMDAQVSSSGAEISTNEDSITEVIAEVGDSINVSIKVTDNKSVDTLRAAALYTNFLDKPDDMNLYYSNNFDSSSYGSNVDDISTSFYQWNSGNEDVAFDEIGTISWGTTDVIIDEEPLTFSNAAYKNDGGVVQIATISFDMTFNGPIDSSEVWVEARDAAGNHFDIQLPMTLTVLGDADMTFDGGDQKLLAFFDKSYLSAMVSSWNNSEGDVDELSTILGIPDENLPSWTTNLATWVADDKIDVADMIVAVEHIINQ